MRSVLVTLALLMACSDAVDVDADTDSDTKSPLLDLDASKTWKIPGMIDEAHVVYGEMDVPWVYAKNRTDLGRALGFVLARDRLFYMELSRRLSQGRISELLGEAGLETDIESRATGMTFIVDHLETLVGEDAEMAGYIDGVAAGVNAAIAAMKAGTLPPPSEILFAGGLLGATTPTDLLTEFTRRDVIAGVVTVLYESGFETKDVGRARDAQRLDTAMVGWPHEALRRAGLLEDVWDRVEPPVVIASAPDWLAAHPPTRATAARRGRHVPVQPAVLDRLHEQLQRVEKRLGHDWEHGFGSNAWAVSGAASADGRGLLASDGHLQLSVPPLFFQVGIDTEHLGGGDIHQVGLMTPAIPFLSTGTNGKIAFGQTQLMGDITDWYSEKIVLNGNGAPAASIFDGQERPLVAHVESIIVKTVPPPLGGPGGTTTFTRYTTFDGRWISSIEGDEVDGPEAAPEGSTAVLMGGKWVVPRDVDGIDGITAVSFDYAGLDLSNMLGALDRYNKAADVQAFAKATEDLVAYSLNLVAADANGDVLYTSFQATPCRTYLDRNGDGTWAEGADPNLLLDGTRYPGFTIPLVDGRVDFGQSDPTKCVIPWSETPHAFTPGQGYVVTGNNDPGGLTFDGSLTNDEHYFGGPWIEGYRADAIARDLEAKIAGGGVTLDDMKAGQANHESTIGRQLVPELLAALDAAEALTSGGELSAASSEGRMAALWTANEARFEEARDRLAAWQDRGGIAASGVETFYHQPSADQKDDAVATMIFNAWMGRYVGFVVGDEDLPGLGWPTGDTGRFRLLTFALNGRGPSNPLDLGSWNPDTEESIFFDIQDTEALETSHEVAVLALAGALDFLESPTTDPGKGGFGTTDMDAYLWGLRHLARMTSLIGDFLGADDPFLGPILEPFNITPDLLPLAESLPEGDPRIGLEGFPRPGDHLNIDALNSGTSGTSFTSGSGSVMRMVVAMGGEKGFEAYNVIPGGQSGHTDSVHFTDQARLWLGNEYLPVWLDVDDVVSHGKRRELFQNE